MCVLKQGLYLAQVASPGASTSPEGQVREVTEPREHDSIKYPDIKLPTYNGQVTDWIEFRDTFDALVNQTSLKPIQKFKYLKGCLTDSALEVVSSLEFAEESHALAWQLLCERYNNPKTLVYSHLRALFNIDPVPNTATALRSLNDNISKHLRILRSVKVPTNDWDLLIIFFLTSKLDRILQTKWEEKMNSRELPNLQDFKSFLRSQADLREAVSQTEPATRGLPAAREAMVTTCPPSHTNSKVVCNFVQIAQNQALQTFWNSDNCHSTPAITDQEYLQCEKVFNQHYRTPDGNFVVSIPFKEPPTF
ncbi:unnamed protein product [Plutella xylostella]|uniref:(diamondback moth) hypothetical protein n=1 Tax=Plutella xylostella TaxID=51655 RepID=A0A8S4G1T1_PLUXY|nr:unnamed protein product [Plutella xylostella]